MSTLTFASLAFGLALLFGAHWLGRFIVRNRDPVALTRILQVTALIIVALALLFWPRSPESTAFPPPPEGPPGASQ